MNLSSFPLDLILIISTFIEDIDTINLANTKKSFNSDRIKFVRFNLNKEKSLEYLNNKKFKNKIKSKLKRIDLQLKLNFSYIGISF